jgi:hypothetical protein
MQYLVLVLLILQNISFSAYKNWMNKNMVTVKKGHVNMLQGMWYVLCGINLLS